MTPTKVIYRPDIDGLRALAVIAVIINHFNKNLLPSGYLGVDIFFVISGFVITSSFARNAALNPPRNLADFLLGFYARRVKRLYPALLVVVINFLRTAEAFHSRGATVVIYLNAPRFPGLEGAIEGYCTPQWFKPFMDPNCSIPSDGFLEPRRRDFASLYKWADGDRRIIWDGVDRTTCGPAICQAQHYKDEAHFRPYYANYLVHLFEIRHAGLFEAQPKGATPTMESRSP